MNGEDRSTPNPQSRTPNPEPQHSSRGYAYWMADTSRLSKHNHADISGARVPELNNSASRQIGANRRVPP
jgi:hypothetical protein